MTKSERREVAATLRRWAAWCEVNPDYGVLAAMHGCDAPIDKIAYRAAVHACVKAWLPRMIEPLLGKEAATGLLLAAAMVEAGDSV
jgi:hypothetical protein